jgi:hypothetical protein
VRAIATSTDASLFLLSPPPVRFDWASADSFGNEPQLAVSNPSNSIQNMNKLCLFISFFITGLKTIGVDVFTCFCDLFASKTMNFSPIGQYLHSYSHLLANTLE